MRSKAKQKQFGFGKGNMQGGGKSSKGFHSKISFAAELKPVVTYKYLRMLYNNSIKRALHVEEDRLFRES